MPIHAYLNFAGNCREAVEYYAKVFKTEKPKIMSFGDMPDNPQYPLPKEAKTMVMHTRLEILGSTVMFSDVFPGMPFTVGSNISLSVVTDNAEELKTAFHQLQEGGKVEMELQETSWSVYNYISSW
ncbi:VOC family protein [Paenibacillus donghaensis]|uniref:PhnB-like domain-containing protein n=1 Tax=Paenibacillus donghaensis TaxID=414771 RepID=A0A2Z2KHP7_9BACL|nr:VOC family protein [Paenibacillus donghaensis]ASA22793.1 hypothetical protein B9T62_19495 [Paenibacillus donghaensis]